jgi:tetratricopeptide (TPR) repeat protein
MTQAIDQGGLATITAATAQAALDRGDVAQARREFAEAGEILEREMRAARDEETEHLLRFLAATQYYKGGHYAKSQELADRIKAAKLPANTGRLLPGFVRDVKERSAPDYQARIRAQLETLWRARDRDYTGILELLAEHPYVISPGDLAFLRAVCCERLGKYRPAVLFFADAARLSPADPTRLSAFAALPLEMPKRGQLEEAWEYVQAQLELYPNAVSYAVASVLCNLRARDAGAEDRSRLFAEQDRLFSRAQEALALLPDTHRTHPEIKAVFGVAYQAMALALADQNQDEEALRWCDEAIALDPVDPRVWALRGIILGVTPEGLSASRKAIELGDRTYFPRFYLAYHAVTHGEHAEARDMAREALELCAKDKKVRSQLYQWWAVSLDQLGAERSQVEDLFRKAVEIDPEDADAQDNYRRFRSSENPLLAPPRIDWRRTFSPANDPLHPDGGVVVSEPDRNGLRVERMLVNLAG